MTFGSIEYRAGPETGFTIDVVGGKVGDCPGGPRPPAAIVAEGGAVCGGGSTHWRFFLL